MPDARSPAAAHQQDFLPLLAAGTRRAASGQLEKERGRRGGGTGKTRRRGEARGRAAGAGPGAGEMPPRPPQPRPPGRRALAAWTQLPSNVAAAPAAPLTTPLSALCQPPTECAPPRGACAEPSTSRSRRGRAGGVLGAGAGGGEAEPIRGKAKDREVGWGLV